MNKVNFQSIRQQLIVHNLFQKDSDVYNNEAAIGMERKFKLSWLATQLYTFFFVINIKGQPLTTELIKKHAAETFKYSKKTYDGPPRGFMTGLASINLFTCDEITPEAIDFVQRGKEISRYAGFSICVLVDLRSDRIYTFKRSKIVGIVYFPYFKKCIEKLTKGLKK